MLPMYIVEKMEKTTTVTEWLCLVRDVKYIAKLEAFTL